MTSRPKTLRPRTQDPQLKSDVGPRATHPWFATPATALEHADAIMMEIEARSGEFATGGAFFSAKVREIQKLLRTQTALGLQGTGA